MSEPENIGELVGQASMLFYNEETKLLDGVFDEKQAEEIVAKILALIANEKRELLERLEKSATRAALTGNGYDEVLGAYDQAIEAERAALQSKHQEEK